MELLKILLFPGIGDILYSWYKLQYYYKLGYSFDIFVIDMRPHRACQLEGMIDGINSINYIDFEIFDKYRLIDPISLLNPNPECLYEGIPFFHTNSFLEAGININDFLSEAPVNYNINIKLEEDSELRAKKILSQYDANIFLYTSCLEVNNYHKNRPDPNFWSCLTYNVIQKFFKDKNVCVHLCGANYDEDLTSLVADKLFDFNINFNKYIDENFHFVCSILKHCDLSLVHGSGFIMLSDIFKIPCISMYLRRPERNNEKFPYTGIVSPMAYYEKRMLPIMHYEHILNINRKLSRINLKK